MTKRELLLRTFHNEPAERVPVGFWFHFAADELLDVFEHPELLDINLAGHHKFYQDFRPDFLKIMTDGFFVYPNEVFRNARRPGELRDMASIGETHPWIEKQIAFAKTIAGAFGSEVLTFYNIFAPATLFKFARSGQAKSPDSILADFIAEDREAVIHALKVAAGDLAILARRIIREAKADGIYYSAQDTDDPRITGELHRDCLAPADRIVLEGANAAGGLNILHICSYGDHRNDLSHFTAYPAQIINWAADLEGIPLGTGKKLFGGRPVIGGFNNTTRGILYRGAREEIEAETKRLLAEAGTTGIVLGADCTIPRDTDLRHLQWVRDAAASFRP
jgi:uroporphyrinogen decarboxylase